MKKNIKITKKLNFFTITRKYWKEQLFFYVLTILSCLGNFFVDNNAWKNIAERIKKGEKAPYELSLDFKLFNLGSYKFFRDDFIFFMLSAIMIYCLIVIAHVYYSYYLTSKITIHVKKKLAKKFLLISEDYHNQKKTAFLFTHNARTFSYLVIFVPNQLFYAFLGTSLTFWEIKKVSGKILLLGVFFFIFILAISAFLQYLFARKEFSFQEKLEKETKEDNFLVENRNLIIKKNLAHSFLFRYNKLLSVSQRSANKRDLIYTLSWVVPSYLLGQMGGFIFLPFAKVNTLVAYNRIVKLSETTKKITERLKEYPVGLTAQKRINNFLQLPSKNNIQKNILISESIRDIVLKNVSFEYIKDEPVLKEFCQNFCVGKVNRLTGENGSGKSTIISLIMGIYQFQKGEILINQKYKLNEINLRKWRQKIAYSEHSNLVKKGLSTGQKQLIDLDNLFAKSERKEIFIFDEADNALDKNNKKKFLQKITKIAQKKLVILVSH